MAFTVDVAVVVHLKAICAIMYDDQIMLNLHLKIIKIKKKQPTE